MSKSKRNREKKLSVCCGEMRKEEIVVVVINVRKKWDA